MMGNKDKKQLHYESFENEMQLCFFVNDHGLSKEDIERMDYSERNFFPYGLFYWE